MTDLTNAPAWVREIAEACESNHARFFKGCVESTVPMAGWYCPNCGGSATRRADIPRLIEAAAGMAEVLEQQLRDDYTDCYGGVVMMAVDCVTCQLRDDCGRSRVLKALAKWRGEAGE